MNTTANPLSLPPPSARVGRTLDSVLMRASDAFRSVDGRGELAPERFLWRLTRNQGSAANPLLIVTRDDRRAVATSHCDVNCVSAAQPMGSCQIGRLPSDRGGQRNQSEMRQRSGRHRVLESTGTVFGGTS